jgi:hypothetical protein
VIGRTWAAFTVTVTPSSSTISWLQSNSRREAQRHVGRSRRAPPLLAPPSGVTPHSIVAAGASLATAVLGVPTAGVSRDFDDGNAAVTAFDRAAIDE